MGILHSISRFFGRKTEEDQEAERLIYPHPTLHQMQNQYYPTNGHSSQKLLLKIFSIIRSLLSRAISGLLKKSDPILPIQNPEPNIISNDPLPVQTLLISSSSDDSTADIKPTTFANGADLDTDDDQELPSDKVVVVSSQQWPKQSHSANKTQIDDVVLSIPYFTGSLAHTYASEEVMGSAVFVEETFPENSVLSQDDRDEEEREEEENVMIKCITVEAVDEERWMKHYSSRHRILLVGEGDFSFSACLAVAFVSASNMIATSLNSKDFLKKNYPNAPSNIENIRSREGKVMHGIDATTIAGHLLLGNLKFDRIIFNFPFAGFFSDLPRESQIRLHRELVLNFLKNAREMISENGEIHVRHKTNGFLKDWKIESLAASHGLRLIEAVKFNLRDYPGYNTKYGFGGNKNFNCYPSKTYKFGLQKVPYSNPVCIKKIVKKEFIV